MCPEGMGKMEFLQVCVVIHILLFCFFQKGLKQYCFVVFLLECSTVATFIFCIIPETKNKTFLEIKREFHKLNFRRAKEPDEESHERQQLCLEV